MESKDTHPCLQCMESPPRAEQGRASWRVDLDQRSGGKIPAYCPEALVCGPHSARVMAPGGLAFIHRPSWSSARYLPLWSLTLPHGQSAGGSANTPDLCAALQLVTGCPSLLLGLEKCSRLTVSSPDTLALCSLRCLLLGCLLGWLCMYPCCTA